MELCDIESVQVLCGLQGILFGCNIIGGVVLINIQVFGDELGGKVCFGIGEDLLIEVFGVIDIFISDDLLICFIVGIKKQDGYVKCLYDGLNLGDINNIIFLVKIYYDLNEKFIVKLFYDYIDVDENGFVLVFVGYNNNNDVINIFYDVGWFGVS